MPQQYNQLRASFSLAKASIINILRSPTSIVFSILFPIIFIIVFGSLVDATIVPMKVAMTPGSDTANVVYRTIRNIPHLSIDTSQQGAAAVASLKKGTLTAIIDLEQETSPYTHYTLKVTTNSASGRSRALLQVFIENGISAIDKAAFGENRSIATILQEEVPGRVYKKIDFILPGQLGFSLLMAGVFGSAFLLFGLRKGLVLKRLSATPISRRHIIIGEMISRLLFHLFSYLIMIGLGYFAFDFTLVNGFATLVEMLLFSILGLLVFMGIGFIISGSIQNESSVTPIANTFTLPQILLCGLFFSIENYPDWLQWFCNILPLTFLVDGLRKIGFEGAHIWQMPVQLWGLTTWGIVVTIFAIKAFKWE